MSAFRESQFVAGPGWTADVSAKGAEIHVAPAGDPLPGAVERLVSPTRRRYVTVEWVGEDDRGWDVYDLALAREDVHLTLV